MERISRQEVSFAPGEDTYGLRVFREEWKNSRTGRATIYWKYGLPDGVQVLGLTSDGLVIAIEDHHHSIGNYLHLVSGAVEKGETPLATARREFLEETGYEPLSMELLSAVLENSVKSNRLIWMYLAHGRRKVGMVEAGITVRLFRPPDFWQHLISSFLDMPEAKHGGGNSLKAAALAFSKLDLVTVKEVM